MKISNKLAELSEKLVTCFQKGREIDDQKMRELAKEVTKLYKEAVKVHGWQAVSTSIFGIGGTTVSVIGGLLLAQNAQGDMRLIDAFRGGIQTVDKVTETMLNATKTKNQHSISYINEISLQAARKHEAELKNAEEHIVQLQAKILDAESRT